MNIKGNIKLIGETQTFGSGFRKRQLVVTTEEQYPQDVAIDFVQDKVDLLNSYEVGQSVDVSINIRGNEYNGKYYVNLQGWRIVKAEQSQPKAQAQPQAEEDLDLPF
jgi:hypothetical protein